MSYVDAPTIRWVQVKQFWGDPWFTVNYLYPEIGTFSTSPTIGSAEFKYEFGRITGTGLAPWQDRTPLALDQYFIRIVFQYGVGTTFEETAFVPWLGIVTDSSLELVAGDIGTSSGTQRILARQIEHEWDQVPLQRSRAKRDTAGVTIDYYPSFNRRREVGNGVFGNRSTAKLAGESFYRFDDRKQATEDDVWLARDVVDYILAVHRPSCFAGVSVSVSDPADALNQFEQVWDLGGRTAYDALNEVISRRRGLVWYFDIDGSGNLILRVSTATPSTISVGGGVLPANPDQGAFVLPGSFPDKHILEELLVRTTTRAAYNRVVVRGERIRVMGSFCYGDNGQLIKGWSNANETDYNNPGGADAEEKDRRRTREKYAAVWSRHLVKRSWDGRTGNEIGGAAAPLLFRVTADGTLQDDAVGDWWRGGKRFLRETFLRREWDYTVDPPADNATSETDIDYLPIIVLLKDDLAASQQHQKTDKWFHLERLGKAFEGIGGGFQVTPLDTQLGVEIKTSPAHLLAGGDFTGSTEFNSPEFDYKKLVVTAAMEHDQRIKVVRTIAGGETRELIIDVPDCHFWWIHPEAVIGVKDDGSLEKSATRIIRDDRPRLGAIGAAASAWYSVPRQAVTFPLRRIRAWVNPGRLITSISGFSVPIPVNAIVTSLTYDFRGTGMVSVQTGWGERDYAPTFV
jgi:hypothetical protein